MDLELPNPPAPIGLAATGGDAQVTLNWTASPGATGYNLKRSTADGGPYTFLAGPTATNYTDTTTGNGTNYYYVVSAANGSGESPDSAQVSARPVSTTSPQLDYSVLDGPLQFIWPSDHVGWRLEAQTNSPEAGLGTNWVTIPASSGTNQMFVPIEPASGSVFFRLVYP